LFRIFVLGAFVYGAIEFFSQHFWAKNVPYNKRILLQWRVTFEFVKVFNPLHNIFLLLFGKVPSRAGPRVLLPNHLLVERIIKRRDLVISVEVFLDVEVSQLRTLDILQVLFFLVGGLMVEHILIPLCRLGIIPFRVAERVIFPFHLVLYFDDRVGLRFLFSHYLLIINNQVRNFI